MSGREIMFYIRVPFFRLYFVCLAYSVVEVVPGCSFLICVNLRVSAEEK